MFNIGVGELIVILLIAFILVGPSDLPKVARALAKGYKKLKRLINEIKAAIDFEEEFEEVKDLKNEMVTLSKDVKKDIDPVSMIKNEVNDVKKTLNSIEKEK